ncbi:MAG: hypothetical protein LBS79_04280 [Tannerella sp.]|jgi:hypothetical protein|nr:hypothetical protein [Tannerella sp.]
MKKKRREHYCKICGEYKANEKFSGKGHANHICKVCSALPVARRNELQRINRIFGIGMNFFIPKDKLGLLKKYAGDSRYPEAAQHARDILDRFDGRSNLQENEFWEEDEFLSNDEYILYDDSDINNEPFK